VQIPEQQAVQHRMQDLTPAQLEERGQVGQSADVPGRRLAAGLQPRLHVLKQGAVDLCIFDLPYYQGVSLEHSGIVRREEVDPVDAFPGAAIDIRLDHQQAQGDAPVKPGKDQAGRCQRTHGKQVDG